MNERYSLIIPSWYPTPYNNMAGIFIQKHVQLISTFKKVIVIYAQESDSKVGHEVFNDYEYVFYYKKGFAAQLSYLITFFKAFLFIKKKFGSPSIIHLHVAYPASIVAVLLSVIYKTPLILTEHWTGYMDSDGRYLKLSLPLKWFIKKSFSIARKVSVVSTSLKQVIIGKELTTTDKVVLVYNSLHLPLTENIRSAEQKRAGVNALTVAHLTDAHKNISLLINAVELVVRKYPDFKLTIVGGGPESEKFVELAKSKNLYGSHVCFTGYLSNSDVMAQYPQHDFYILTSNFETFSIATAEAILHGLPVVSTKCGGPEEFVNESNGVFIEVITAEKTADAIICLISKIETYNSQEISAELGAKFSEDKVVVQLKSLYKFGEQ